MYFLEALRDLRESPLDWNYNKSRTRLVNRDGREIMISDLVVSGFRKDLDNWEGAHIKKSMEFHRGA